MEFQFASRMEQFQAGIFGVLDQKRREVEATGGKDADAVKVKYGLRNVSSDSESGYCSDYGRPVLCSGDETGL